MVGISSVWSALKFAAVGWLSVVAAIVGLFLLKCIYNISPFHPLSKYPGPLLWRASRLFASYHHATGTLYQRIALIHSQYGPTVRIAPSELSFTAPEAWPQIYNARPQLEKGKYHFGGEDNERLPQSMITVPDAEHTRLRRLLNPAFLNAGVNEVEPVLQRYVNLLCSSLAEDSQDGTPQNIGEWYLWALNDVIGQLSLDQEFECLTKRRLHPWPNFLLGLLKLSAAANQFARFGFSLRWLAPLMSQETRAKAEGFLRLATDAVSKRLRRDEEEQYGNEQKRQDIIGLMLRDMKGREKLSEPEIVSNAILIVGGGAETTSTCLSATTYHLCKFPRVMQKLKDEIRGTLRSSDEITLKATMELPYLKAVIDESLRKFPVASYLPPRTTPKEGHVIDGEVIPGGTYVSMGQWYMGNDPQLFDDPHDFRPERFLNSDIQAVSGRRADEILKPFSMGKRNCIGQLLALAELRLVIAKLVWHFDIELVGDHADWVQGARFYVLWELQPLKVRLTAVKR